MANTALQRTETALLTNKSGGSVAQGDLVIVDTANAAAFTTTTTSAYIAGRVGVVLEPNGIASNAVGTVAFGGYVPIINLSGTGSIGDLVKTHTTAKQGIRHVEPQLAGDFAQVLGTSATPAALLFGTVQLGTGGGYTTLKTVWNPDATPASPSAYDDEFQGGSGGLPASGLWTEFDPNSILTVTEESATKRLQFSTTTRTGDNLVGIHQSIPAGDFTIWTKVSSFGFRNNNNYAGLGLWENPADTSKSIMVNGLTINPTSMLWEGTKYTNHNTWNASSFSYTIYHATSLYLRIRRNSTNYFHGMSMDGISWYEYGTSAFNPLATPTKFGLILNQNNTGQTLKNVFGFFRYVASDVGLTGVMNGNLVKLLY